MSKRCWFFWHDWERMIFVNKETGNSYGVSRDMDHTDHKSRCSKCLKIGFVGHSKIKGSVWMGDKE